MKSQFFAPSLLRADGAFNRVGGEPGVAVTQVSGAQPSERVDRRRSGPGRTWAASAFAAPSPTNAADAVVKHNAPAQDGTLFTDLVLAPLSFRFAEPADDAYPSWSELP